MALIPAGQIIVRPPSDITIYNDPLDPGPMNTVTVYTPPPQNEPGIIDKLIEWWNSPRPGPKPLPAPKPKSGPLVVYQKPRYSTKKLPRYGRKYTGWQKYNRELFEKFGGSGRVDPIFF